MIAGSATPMQERTMWKPRVKAICSRAASRFDADAASGSGSSASTRLLLAPLPVAANQRVGRAVVVQLRLLGGLQLGDDLDGQDLAQLDPPLVKGVDPPDRSLGEDAVLVEGDQRAQGRWRQAVGEDRVRGTVALHHAVWDDILGRPLLAHLL